MRLLLLLWACGAVSGANHQEVQAAADQAEIALHAGTDFSDRPAYFAAVGHRRGLRYLATARRWQVELARVANMDEEEEDSFVYSWLVTQHLRGAIRLGANSSEVMTLAAVVAAEAAAGPEAEDSARRLVGQCMRRVCQLHENPAAAAAALRTAFTTLSSSLKKSPKYTEKLLRSWEQGTGSCGSSSVLPALHPVIPNPSALGSCQADQGPGCAVTQHKLWPAQVGTTRLEVGEQFHSKLSQTVIEIYLEFSKTQGSRARAEDINNAFFSQQLKSDSDIADAGVWPQLYHSPEYTQLRTQIRTLALDQGAAISSRPRELLERCVLVLWAAVYTEDTPHLTHVHESSVVSGSYYSQAPEGAAPIVFTDPRGGQSMHSDAVKPEGEPEAPFIHTQSFFPRTGDVVLFPSWLPHRVPPAPKGTAPRVSWAFNLECGEDSWLWTSH